MRQLLIPKFVMLYAIALMVVLNQYLPVQRLWPTHICWIGVPLIVIGLAMAQWHARLFKAVGTNINTFSDPDILTTSGFFRYSRNPMYLGFMFVLVGVCLVLGSTTPWVVLAGFFLLTRYWYIPYEERAMLQRFGDDYLEYKRRVRRWL